jgi:hypothetical protein
MSKIEVINFEEKVRKMKRSSKVNGFSGMIKMLRHMFTLKTNFIFIIL